MRSGQELHALFFSWTVDEPANAADRCVQEYDRRDTSPGPFTFSNHIVDLTYKRLDGLFHEYIEESAWWSLGKERNDESSQRLEFRWKCVENPVGQF